MRVLKRLGFRLGPDLAILSGWLRAWVLQNRNSRTGFTPKYQPPITGKSGAFKDCAGLVSGKSQVAIKLLAPNTSEPRDVPRCGALSLLQKTPHYRGDPAETAARLTVKLCDLTD